MLGAPSADGGSSLYGALYMGFTHWLMRQRPVSQLEGLQNALSARCRGPLVSLDWATDGTSLRGATATHQVTHTLPPWR